MALEENFIITIHGTMEPGLSTPHPEDIDTVELITRGYFAHKGGSFFISYQETETTGYAGCTTTVKISEKADRVAMLRFGPAESQLIIEKGTRHICHYDTGHGALSLGVAADEITQNLTENGGEAQFSYTLDADSQLLSCNRVHITVKPAN